MIYCHYSVACMGGSINSLHADHVHVYRSYTHAHLLYDIHSRLIKLGFDIELTQGLPTHHFRIVMACQRCRFIPVPQIVTRLGLGRLCSNFCLFFFSFILLFSTIFPFIQHIFLFNVPIFLEYAS